MSVPSVRQPKSISHPVSEIGNRAGQGDESVVPDVFKRTDAQVRNDADLLLERYGDCPGVHHLHRMVVQLLTERRCAKRKAARSEKTRKPAKVGAKRPVERKRVGQSKGKKR